MISVLKNKIIVCSHRYQPVTDQSDSHIFFFQKLPDHTATHFTSGMPEGLKIWGGE